MVAETSMRFSPSSFSVSMRDVLEVAVRIPSPVLMDSVRVDAV
jgi:hypothetical protein